MILDVYPIGTAVEFGIHKGTVLRVQITPGPSVLYEVGFWCNHGHDWKELWLNSFAVTLAGPERLQIGYVPPPR